MRIVSGTVTCRINLEQFQFSSHDIQMSPPDTILELIECSDDFSMQLLVIKSLPGVDREAFRQGLAPMPMKVSLDEADWQMSPVISNCCRHCLATAIHPPPDY